MTFSEVIWWDARYEDKGKHGKFDRLWKGHYEITTSQGKNTYMLQEVSNDLMVDGPVNGHFLKHYLTQ